MKGYSVHLLFHLLAVVAGGAAGVAAGLWWFAGNQTALWIAGASLAVGIIVLVLEGLYISGVQAPEQRRRRNRGRRRRPQPQPRPRGGTRPNMVSVTPPSTGTTVQPPAEHPSTTVQPPVEAADGETRKSAAEALREWSANHRS